MKVLQITKGISGLKKTCEVIDAELKMNRNLNGIIFITQITELKKLIRDNGSNNNFVLICQLPFQKIISNLSLKELAFISLIQE